MMAYRSLVLVSREASVSNCLETDGSVLELTSSGFRGSGMVNLVLAAKDLTGKEMRGEGFVQVWMEIREARDVRVRRVVNIVF